MRPGTQPRDTNSIGRWALGPNQLLILTMVFWGSAFPTSEIAVRYVPHEVAALGRFGLGAIVLVGLLLVTRRSGHRASLTPRQWLLVCLAGAVGVYAYNALFFWGLTFAPSVDGALIVPVLSPIFTMLFVVVTKQERASRERIVGFAFAIAGAAVFFAAVSAATPAGSLRLLGDGIFLLGAVTWASYTVLSKRAIAGLDPLVATTWGTVAGSALLAVMAVPSLHEVQWDQLPPEFWINAAYLGILPTAVAYLFYYRGVRDVGPASSATMMFLVPVFGTVSAFILLGQQISLGQAAGGLLMIVGALLAVSNGRIRLPGTGRSRPVGR